MYVRDQSSLSWYSKQKEDQPAQIYVLSNLSTWKEKMPPKVYQSQDRNSLRCEDIQKNVKAQGRVQGQEFSNQNKFHDCRDMKVSKYKTISTRHLEFMIEHS